MAPVSTKAKIAIESTWLLNLHWDDPLPQKTATEWVEFHNQWPLLADLQISRPIMQSEGNDFLEIHGFADASERAYGAVIFLRSKPKDGNTQVKLLTAKGRIAPLKQVSLPRLELCAVQLLANLAKWAVEVTKLENIPMHLWSDSTVTLGWIKGHPTQWMTYVANRVSEIQRAIPQARWHHVKGAENPADCASRGLNPSDLVTHPLWWSGPEFLSSNEPCRPTDDETHSIESLPESRLSVHVNTTTSTEENPLLKRFSKYNKLMRITAWCLRWRLHKPTTSPNPSSHLSADDITKAEHRWITLTQNHQFSEKKRLIQAERTITGPLAKLCPFIDAEGILRVGGRLLNASLTYNEKHPIILPGKSQLTWRLINATHQKTLHGGTQLTLATLRQRFWIPKGRHYVKACIHQCSRCVRWKATVPTQLMANLPPACVNSARPFQFTGVDYAGPIYLREASGRGKTCYKGFFVVFVCLTTRAIHLEVASDYSTNAFIAAFRRFTSRRGVCSELFSDRETNFVGADRELQRLFDANTKEGQTIRTAVNTERVKWSFNPPGAPHFGGIWEAGVKSVKHDLHRVVGETRLTFEEMTTLLTQIEACLNSRPLCAMSDDPEDMAALIPGHFLIGTALTAIPEPTLLDTKIHHLSRWQHLIKMRNHFWQRWKHDYLSGLNQRNKWTTKNESLQIVQLCVIRTEATPPTRWALALPGLLCTHSTTGSGAGLLHPSAELSSCCPHCQSLLWHLLAPVLKPGQRAGFTEASKPKSARAASGKLHLRLAAVQPLRQTYQGQSRWYQPQTSVSTGRIHHTLHRAQFQRSASRDHGGESPQHTLL
ncbi:uncharacterized protein [Venturia canescens]|uniref:uncharacterized protein n=1 Tax=Venturia canescens TaxID=32260 RepID=UPI001C9C3F3D|nr:uncharacterized protein LOC122411343 [Venturia canescens]